MFEISTLLSCIVALPLASALATAVLGPRVLRNYSHVPTVLALLGAFVGSVLLFAEVQTRQQQETAKIGFSLEKDLWTWASVGNAFAPEPGAATDFTIEIVLRGDALTAPEYAIGLSRPRELFETADGRILVGEELSGEVTEITGGGNFTGDAPFASGLDTPYGIAESASGETP